MKFNVEKNAQHSLDMYTLRTFWGGGGAHLCGVPLLFFWQKSTILCSVLINSPSVTTPDFSAVLGHYSVPSIWGIVLHPFLGHCPAPILGALSCTQSQGTVLHPVSGHCSAPSLGALICTQSQDTVLHPVLGHCSASSLRALFFIQSQGTVLHPVSGLFCTQSRGTVLHPISGHCSAPILGALSCTHSWSTVLHPFLGHSCTPSTALTSLTAAAVSHVCSLLCAACSCSREGRNCHSAISIWAWSRWLRMSHSQLNTTKEKNCS